MKRLPLRFASCPFTPTPSRPRSTPHSAPRMLAGLVILLIAAPMAFGQGMIVDRRPEIPMRGQYTVEAIEIDADVRDQVATVQVSQTLKNPTGRALEAEFLFPLPEAGAVQNFVLMVDGQELPGELMDAEEARTIYESIVRQKKDPALLEYAGRGLFKTSVFPIPAGQTRTLTLKYTHLLKREFATVQFVHPFSHNQVTNKPVGKLSVDLRIEAGRAIKNLYSPSHAVDIRRPDKTTARVTLEQNDLVPEGDLRLFYTLSDAEVDATVLSYKPEPDADGYFMLLASPGFGAPDRAPAAKTVIFVIDKSGSMSGKKIDHAREAARFILNNLKEGDTFNIITYNDAVETWKPELQTYNPDTRKAALAFVDGIRDGGSTNINDALTTANAMVRDPDRPAYVLFLTDGLPTAGEQDELKIAKNVAAANEHDARLIAFGVGYDVNARLLDRLAEGNHGASEYVTPDENLETAVSRFHGKLTAPVLARPSVAFKNTQVNRTHPRELPDLFEGGQVVYVGRYTDRGETTIELTGKVGDKTRRFTYPATLASANSGAAYGFVEKLWAQRRIGYIIDQIDLHGQNEELMSELVTLSKKHGILTPYTSFFADENTNLARTDALEDTTRANLSGQLAQTTGSGAVRQREVKGQYKRAAQTSAPADVQAEADQAAGADAEAAQPGSVIGYDDQGRAQRVNTVRNVGNRTFYQRQGQWIDSRIDKPDEAEPIDVVQFSDAYFALTRDLTAEQNQYLTFTEPTLVELNGQVYNILPADPDSD